MVGNTGLDIAFSSFHVIFFRWGCRQTKGELSCFRDSFDICLLESGHVERGLWMTKSVTYALVLLGALDRLQEGSAWGLQLAKSSKCPLPEAAWSSRAVGLSKAHPFGGFLYHHSRWPLIMAYTWQGIFWLWKQWK